MDVAAVTKYVRMSGEKVRDLARRMQGVPVAEALRVAELSGRKAGRLMEKTLKSAIANAENNAKLTVDDLKVKEAVINSGPTLKRSWPRARGSASPILKRTCHIKIVLTDGRAEDEAEVEGAGQR